LSKEDIVVTVGLYHTLGINNAYHLITYRIMHRDPTPSFGLRFKMHGHVLLWLRCCTACGLKRHALSCG